MEYRQLGKRGPRLSVLGLGSSLTIRHRSDEETSRQKGYSDFVARLDKWWPVGYPSGGDSQS